MAHDFVDFFRASAPYIHAHRGRTFVVCFGGEMVTGPRFSGLMQDIALMHSLGVRLVLVHGARPQIEESIQRRGGESRFLSGRRVTDAVGLMATKEAVGALRVEIESRLSMGLATSPMAGARIRVATGNFVVAQPLGVVDGVDHLHTGLVRRVDASGIEQRLADGAIVLLSPLGYSLTGEVFNVEFHEVAAATARALGAEKLVILVNAKGVVDGRKRLLHELAVAEAVALTEKKHLSDELRAHLRAAVGAVQGGVPRAHLVDRRVDGALLRELFTRDGVGTLVTDEDYEGLRQATLADVTGILALIEPLEAAGVLVRRSRELLERAISDYVVIERDGLVIGCGALHPFEKTPQGEIACLAVHDDYRTAGRGDALLSYLERRARNEGLKRLFVLTTRTLHWFQERGYAVVKPQHLPAARRKLYSAARNSKVLSKGL